jgi:hypothetical protein
MQKVEINALLHAEKNQSLEGLRIRQNEGFGVEIRIKSPIESINEFPLTKVAGMRLVFKDEKYSDTPLRVKTWTAGATTAGGTAPVQRPSELLLRMRVENSDFSTIVIEPPREGEEEGIDIFWFCWMTLPNIAGEQTEQIIAEGTMRLLPKV